MGVVDATEWACILCGHHIQNDWIEQQICIQFCLKLEHSSTKTLLVIQKATAVGSWWLAASSRQSTYSCISSRAEFFDKTSNHPGDSAPLQPRFGALKLLGFPQTKISFKGKRFQTVDEIQENTMGQLMATGRAVEVQDSNLKETEMSLSYVQCFLYLVSSSINVSIFHITWLDTFWIDLVYIPFYHHII